MVVSEQEPSADQLYIVRMDTDDARQTMIEALEMAKTARLSESTQDYYVQLNSEYSIKVAMRDLSDGTNALCATIVYEGSGGQELPKPVLRCAATEPANVQGYPAPFIQADAELQAHMRAARERLEYLADFSQGLKRTLTFNREASQGR